MQNSMVDLGSVCVSKKDFGETCKKSLEQDTSNQQSSQRCFDAKKSAQRGGVGRGKGKAFTCNLNSLIVEKKNMKYF